MHEFGNSLVVQWLGLLASTSGAVSSILVRELRSHMLCGVTKKKRNGIGIVSSYSTQLSFPNAVLFKKEKKMHEFIWIALTPIQDHRVHFSFSPFLICNFLLDNEKPSSNQIKYIYLFFQLSILIFSVLTHTPLRNKLLIRV